MEHFNIGRILEVYGPDIEELSKKLFPHVKYPRQAFDRITKGEANLDSMQIEILAEYLGIFVSDLFTFDDDLRGSYNNFAKCLTFVKGEYSVDVNYNGAFLTLYKNGSKLRTIVYTAKPSMDIAEFIELISNLIKNQENGNIEN